ncbi:MAG: hypothetical protein NTW86_27185 [Candidatus Sumerlaeota bacterium]|nr:hypothetical protein [Candidatus Sumerlaeota bacterium]
MKQTAGYIHSMGTARCWIAPDRCIVLPVAPGILKHPALEDLPGLLEDPDVARKYTVEALRRAPWQVVREFDRRWLLECLAQADLSPGRRAALEFLLLP